MKKQNLKRILILIIPVFLFLGGYEAKADTFTWMDIATYSLGGAGFDICNQCHFTYLLQTDQPSYYAGDTVNIVYNYIDPMGNITPQAGNKLLVGALNYNYSSPLLFSGNELLTDSNWSNSLPTIYTNPVGTDFDFTGNAPSGVYVINYTGVYNPDEEVYLYPFTTFQVNDPVPSNNNPVVDVR